MARSIPTESFVYTQQDGEADKRKVMTRLIQDISDMLGYDVWIDLQNYAWRFVRHGEDEFGNPTVRVHLEPMLSSYLITDMSGYLLMLTNTLESKAAEQDGVIL